MRVTTITYSGYKYKTVAGQRVFSHTDRPLKPLLAPPPFHHPQSQMIQQAVQDGASSFSLTRCGFSLRSVSYTQKSALCVHHKSNSLKFQGVIIIIISSSSSSSSSIFIVAPCML